MRRLLELNEGVIAFFSIGFTVSVLMGLLFESRPNIWIGVIFGGVLALIRLILSILGVKVGAEYRNG